MRNALFVCIAGAGLWILTELMEISAQGSTNLSLSLTSIWHPLLAIGFWGLHLAQSKEKNTLSLIGTVLIIVSFLVYSSAGILMIQTATESFSELLGMYSFYYYFGLLSMIGYVTFGIAVIRTRFFPPWSGYGFILFVVLSFLQIKLGWSEMVQHGIFIGFCFMLIHMSISVITTRDRG